MRWSLLIAICLGSARLASAQDVTFNRDVAPILWKHCASCHRESQIGPFPLLSFEDAAKRARQLKQITASRRMPPWKPEPGFGEFRDDRRMSDADVAVLGRWADSGAKEGDPADLPKLPTFPASGWHLGEPDAVFEMPEAFEVPPTGSDIFRCFVIPSKLNEDRWVAAVEIRPGNRRIVHHANCFIDVAGQARKLSEKDGKPGYTPSPGLPAGVPIAGLLGGWSPGSLPHRLPEITSKPLIKASDLILQVHYHSSGKPETDRTSVGVYYAKKPPERHLFPVIMKAVSINIPPGARRYRVAESFTIPADVKVVSISPHMHLIGREMKVTAKMPDGTVKGMIWIKDWDFNWQGVYYYPELLPLPSGTRIDVEAFYDNSSGNPQNPNVPPKPVHGGNGTGDEMCQCQLQMIAVDQAGGRALVKAIRAMQLERKERDRVAADATKPKLMGPKPAPSAIEKPKPAEANLAPEGEITFNRNVAPLLWKHCAECHRPDQVGPFPLLTFQDAAKQARQLKDVTASQRMPPWKPAPGWGEFHGERRLSAAELAVLARWADGGAKEGDPADLPKPPAFPPPGWHLGEPDAVFEMPEPFDVPATGKDIFRCLVIPTNLTEDRWVSGIEIRPGNRRVVHHTACYVDTTGEAQKLSGKDGRPGYTTFGSPGVKVSLFLGGWAPGAKPRLLPEGISRPLAKGADLLLQIHYHPTGKPERDRTVVGLYYAKKPTERRLMPVQLIGGPINIPPNEKRYRLTDSFTLPADVKLFAVSPHMHLLGREMKVTATLPDGTVKGMVWIKDWDFNWQGLYHYRDVVSLPKGTRLDMEAFYDNSADNPQNPNHPPRRVFGGMSSTAEMCNCYVQLCAVDESGTDALAKAQEAKQEERAERRKMKIPKK